ncbi:RebB family R body protein [Nisaea sp.]|uniref:RebB family R body protein n=1 Tax=Nisaea sp. TaxID=2024842 RepID=UPI003B515FC7
MTDDSVFGTDDTTPDDEPGFGAGGTESGGSTTGEAGTGEPAASESGAGSSGAGSGTGGGATPAAASVLATTGSGPGVNSQILDAVTQSNGAVLGAAGSNGSAIAYQKVAQAAAFAVQDSTDYLRNIMAMSSAATGVALKKMVENPATAAQYTPVLTAAQTAVTEAQKNFSAVGSAAGTVVDGFPSGS